MQVGYIPGVWDLLHVGHITILKRARGFCDKLIVGVPSDNIVMEDKHKPPAIILAHRTEMLRELRCVDEVVPYYKLEFITHLKIIRPQFLFVGETWGCLRRHKEAVEWCGGHGCKIITFPYSHMESTSDIKHRIKENV